MSTSVSPAVQAKSFPDGTTDYEPIRGGSKHDGKKVHIADQPMTANNWYKHIDWLSTTFIVFIPIMGFVSAYWVPLHLYTAIFSVVWYFNTGLGITAGTSLHSDFTFCRFCFREFGGNETKTNPC
jgi:stearoyl-CoA desaturase (delta-9 desaturase)